MIDNIVFFVLFPSLFFCLAMIGWTLYKKWKMQDKFYREREACWRRNGWIK